MKPINTSRRIRSALGLLLLLVLQITLASLLSFPPQKNELPAGTKINGLSVAGLTGPQAMEVLRESLPENLRVELVAEEEKWRSIELPLNTVGAGYAEEDLMKKTDQLLNPHWKDRWLNQLGAGLTSFKLESPLEYNSEDLMDWSSRKAAKLSKDARDASLTIVKGKVRIKEHEMGYRVNDSKLAEAVETALKNENFDTVKVKVDVIAPEMTTSALGNFEQVLASYQTNLGSNKNRHRNIELGAEKINGVRLETAEVFSFNEVVGKVSVEDGYQPAPVIQNGKLVQGVGGGICQVSSTLYQAALNSGMEIVERRNHSLPVGYVPLGLDATIAYGIQDFRFENPYPFPVLIGAWIDDEELHTILLGDINHEKEVIRIETRNQQIINPPVTIVEDPLLEEEVEIVQQQGQKGYRVSVYRIIGDRENEMKEELISRDYYRPVQRIIRRGTGEELEKRKNE